MRQRLIRAIFKSGIAGVLTLAFAIPRAMATGDACRAIFQTDETAQTNIDQLFKELASMRLKLDEAKAAGKRSVAITALESDYFRKEREIFEALVKSKIMSSEELAERFRLAIAKAQAQSGGKAVEEGQKQEDQKRKEQNREMIDALDPVNTSKKLTFHEIKPGKFKMGEVQVETEITQPFEMMETLVTQMMWARLKILMVGKYLENQEILNPSGFKKGTDSIVASIENFHVEMKPDHPVENVSYWDIQDFVEGLNKLSKSSDAKTQDLLERFIPGHKRGDVYDLPTEAQWEFVVRDRGHANKTYFDRDDDGDLQNYAWGRGNSGNQTHAVATLQPRMIDGKPFYDLEGNVSEWIKDWYGGSPKGGADPQGPATGTYPIVRSGSWNHHAGSGIRYQYTPEFRIKSLGFRLVRARR